jgi:hypothetical protein
MGILNRGSQVHKDKTKYDRNQDDTELYMPEAEDTRECEHIIVFKGYIGGIYIHRCEICKFDLDYGPQQSIRQ